MEQPLVSVAFITYNHASFVGEGLSSAAEQDYPNLEVVVADDGSTDGTMEIINEYAHKYPDRFVVLPSKCNQGVRGILLNYNRALAAAKGKYISFLDGDDMYLPGKITKQVEWLEADGRRVLCGHDVDVFDSMTGRNLYFWSERFPLRMGRGADTIVRYNVPFGTLSIMVRATSVPACRLDDRLRVIGDWKLWIDCLASGGYFGYVDGVFARHRRHDNNATNVYSQIAEDDEFVTLALVESQYPHLVSSCKYARASLFYRMGLDSLFRGKRARARVHLMNAVRQTFHWKACRALVLSFLPNKVLVSLLDAVRPGLRVTNTT